MAAFADALGEVVRRVPETEVVMIIGTDGIPIEKMVVRADPNIDAVAAELTALLRSSLSAAADTGLGALRELSVATERVTALLVAITPDYFVFAAFGPDALIGRARFALRLAGASLLSEFE